MSTTVLIRDVGQPWLTTAITAGAGILGALVGGGVTGRVTIRGERERQRFTEEQDRVRRVQERERERIRAGAVARYLRLELREAQSAVATCLKRGCWWPVESQFSPNLDVDQLLLLSAETDRTEWMRIEALLSVIKSAEQMRASVPDYDDEGFLPSLDERGRDVLQYIGKRVDVVIEVLNKFDDEVGRAISSP
jgi:hypothetical protein